MKNSIDWAQSCIANQINIITNNAPTLEKHYESLLRFARKNICSNYGGDFHFADWIALFAAAIDYKPTLVLELGRGMGNSTMVLTEASKIANFQFVSLGLESWDKEQAHLKSEGANIHLENASIIQGDIRLFNFEPIVKDHEKILVFWDAHGFSVTESILSTLMPLIGSKQHWVIMHDIWDTRYMTPEESAYSSRALWMDQEFDAIAPASVRVGHVESPFAEGIGAYDFTSRNGISFETFRHHYECWKSNDFASFKAFHKKIGGNFNEKISFLAHFSLNDIPQGREATYPKPSKALMELMNPITSEEASTPVSERIEPMIHPAAKEEIKISRLKNQLRKIKNIVMRSA